MNHDESSRGIMMGHCDASWCPTHRATFREIHVRERGRYRSLWVHTSGDL